MNNIELTVKRVGEIKGRFLVPSYQRGYRWGKNEVEQLLKDLMDSSGKEYCLQPIVVKNCGDTYELVDGQQRLTTLFLLYKSLHRLGGKLMRDAQFSLEYATRTKSKEYLENIDLSLRDDNIDFWFIANAYECIEDFFEKPNEDGVILDEDGTKRIAIYDHLQNRVSVIWYEIGAEEDAISLFTRLNIGKIPLTSSELVKALFLRRDGEAKEMTERQEELSLQWDNIERDLQDETFWAFLTNSGPKAYATRIDLVLDLMADKDPNDREEYSTFFHFDEIRRKKDLSSIWQDIQHSFLTLKEWRYNHELYHKVGYLIASDHSTLGELFKASRGKTKKEFAAYLDKEISESVNFGKSFEQLNYDKDKNDIERLLLLFNVESVRTLDDGKRWFPFDRHKSSGWSLEHIHAQHSVGLQTDDKRRRWLEDHIPSLQSLKSDKANEVIGNMRDLITIIDKDKKNVRIKEMFEELQQRVVELLSVETGEDYLHGIGNLALLDCGDNAALGNYLFDAKRNKVIEWDKQGKYISFCTKMVFFKYYNTKSDDAQQHFWGRNDMDDYKAAIREKLSPYYNDKTEE